LGPVSSLGLARFGFAAAGFFFAGMLELTTRRGKDESRTTVQTGEARRRTTPVAWLKCRRYLDHPLPLRLGIGSRPGYILRTAGEPFLIGTIGRPEPSRSCRSVIEGLVREHSRKPEEACQWAERLIPTGHTPRRTI
jgi:hypothetical protein